jgi:ketosteroid isomerase-like protein
MSEENVEVVSRLWELLAQENWVAMEGFLCPETEVYDFDIPDAGVYRGRSAVRDWLDEWDKAWDSWDVEDVDIRPAAENRVVAFFTLLAKGRGSGVELKRRDAIFYSLRDAKVVRIEYYNERQKGPALEAAGLSE